MKEVKFKIERNLNRRQQLQNLLRYEIQYIFKSAAEHKLTHGVILSLIKEGVYNKASYKRIGEIGRANLAGCIETNFHLLMLKELAWVCWYNGEFKGLTKLFIYSDSFDQKLMETGYVYKNTTIRYNQKIESNG